MDKKSLIWHSYIIVENYLGFDILTLDEMNLASGKCWQRKRIFETGISSIFKCIIKIYKQHFNHNIELTQYLSIKNIKYSYLLLILTMQQKLTIYSIFIPFHSPVLIFFVISHKRLDITWVPESLCKSFLRNKAIELCNLFYHCIVIFVSPCYVGLILVSLYI